MSPSGPPVTTYCMRAEAPGRSGWLSASFFDSSSHSCVSHFGIRSTPPAFGISGRRSTLVADALTDSGEQVVLGDGGTDQAAGQVVVVVGVDCAGDFRRQPEPE